MSAKVNKLPDEIIDAAVQRLEHGEVEILEAHPGYEECGKRKKEAYKIITKLTREEINTIENAWGAELMVHFGVAYAAGLVDGIDTGKALAGIGRQK